MAARLRVRDATASPCMGSKTCASAVAPALFRSKVSATGAALIPLVPLSDALPCSLAGTLRWVVVTQAAGKGLNVAKAWDFVIIDFAVVC